LEEEVGLKEIIMMRNRSVEEIHIENLSKKRYELNDKYQASWDDEAEDYQNEYPEEIDSLGEEILKYIKLWKNSLPFEFILEELTKLGWAPCLLYDDDGRWAVSGEGMQSVSVNNDNFDCHLSHFVKKDMWKDSIREALNYYLDNS